MPNIKTPYFNLINLMALAIISLSFGCASPQPITGGPQDKTPPKVLSISPKNLTRNFSAKKIVIEFDEYFKIVDETKEFSISPELEKAPILKIKKRSLEISIADTLEKNTTYTLNFGKSIADINESNVLKNFSYVFSTGPEIDSLSLSGKVTNALTGEDEMDVTVLIFPLERDTLFGKKRPSIYTLTDSSGNYKLNNLRKGKYKVYAIKEAKGGGDKVYQQINDEVGYLKEPVNIEKNVENVNLSVFKELSPEFRVTDSKLNNDGSISLSFTQQLKNPDIIVTEPAGVDVGKRLRFSKNNDSAKVWLNDLSFDSIKVAIKDQGKLLQTVNLSRSKKDTYVRDLTPTDNAGAGKLNPHQRYTLNFPLPITSADESKISLLDDSIKRTNFQLLKDSTDFLKYYVIFPWKAKRNYDIKFAAGAFTGIFNSKNKEFTKKFTLDAADNYGNLALNVSVPDTSKSYIIEILNDKKVLIKSYAIRSNIKLNFNNYPAAKYLIRVVYDDNKNGIWDTGNLKSGTQPEKIWYSKDEISLRPNWDIENNLTIPNNNK
ncbi:MULTISPECIES: Ig-like domain-containing protein [unclassified Pedobacter]|uniref:Ig-like domain-containing protein n=1 Tax=unclassified Pedobacter TaxID=2628915 RepID=UPI001E2C61CC|nr:MULTISPECIES: Ig-like domain-containing protein [unclassified Pedobacter]